MRTSLTNIATVFATAILKRHCLNPKKKKKKKPVCLVCYSSNAVSKLKNKNKNYSYSHFLFICYQPVLKTFQPSIHLGFTGYHSFFSHPVRTPVLTGYLLLKHLILSSLLFLSRCLFFLRLTSHKSPLRIWLDKTEALPHLLLPWARWVASTLQEFTAHWVLSGPREEADWGRCQSQLGKQTKSILGPLGRLQAA